MLRGDQLMSGTDSKIQHDPSLLTALQEAMNALQFGHHVTCGAEPGNIFHRTIPLVHAEILKAETMERLAEDEINATARNSYFWAAEAMRAGTD